MSNATETKQADAARVALVSDIQELKGAGQRVAGQAKSVLPWVVAGAGLLAIGGVLALKPARRSSAPQRSLLGKVVRAAALSLVGIVTRRMLTRALNKALPEREPARASIVA